ncbi:MAG: RluA family pseudouridine synthase [Acutalibacteraceae bacterium]
MNNILTFTVPDEYDGCLVKVFLRRYCKVSAHLLVKLKQTENGITRNGEHIRSIDTLSCGDVVKLKMPQDENEVTPSYIPLDILYEDDYILALNKPPFVPVHPVHGHIDDTLANGVKHYAMSNNAQWTFRAINRLDRDTSGIVLTAKDAYTAALLPQTVQKRYIAVCEGELYGYGTIDKPIRLKAGHSIQREVGEGGVNAVTHWKSIKTHNGFTLLDISLETGRTHQIRVHFSDMGYPLAGDDMYGGKRDYISRHALHCDFMSFIHPVTNELIKIICPLPQDIKNLVQIDDETYKKLFDKS